MRARKGGRGRKRSILDDREGSDKWALQPVSGIRDVRRRMTFDHLFDRRAVRTPRTGDKAPDTGVGTGNGKRSRDGKARPCARDRFPA